MPPEEPLQSASFAALEKRQDAFNQQLEKIAQEQKQDAENWPLDYLRELEALSENCRSEGDYDGVINTRAVIKQFNNNNEIADPPLSTDCPKLKLLIDRYRNEIVQGRCLDRARRLISTTREYVNALDDLKKKLTRENKIANASAVNAEIRRAQGSREMLEAQHALDKAAAEAAPGAAKPASLPVELRPSEKFMPLLPLRTNYLAQLNVIATNYEASVTLWPVEYKNAITNLMAIYQQQGRFDDWKTAKSEIDRFDLEQNLLPTNLVTQSRDLVTIQQTYIRKIADYKKLRAANVIAAANNLITKLKDKRRTYTVSNDMEMASVVDAEIKPTQISPEYTAAKQDLNPLP